MKKFIFVLIIGLAVLAGCTEQQMQSVDGISQGIEAVGETGREIISSPVGGLIPEPYKTIANYILIGALGLATAWQKKRKDEMKSVAGSIVEAIEESPDQAQKDVKLRVQNEMAYRGIYDKGKKIVRDLKS